MFNWCLDQSEKLVLTREVSIVNPISVHAIQAVSVQQQLDKVYLELKIFLKLDSL